VARALALRARPLRPTVRPARPDRPDPLRPRVPPPRGARLRCGSGARPPPPARAPTRRARSRGERRMTDAPGGSGVMPVYNAGRWLGQALASVDAQTFRDFELVVVDDGSTEERTRTLLDEAARRPGVTVHRSENRGPALARNLAIERARGAYILPLDADDWLEPAFLAKTVPLLDADPGLGLAYTWVGLAGAHHGVWRTGGFTVPAPLARCTIHVASLFRRELWADVGGYDPAFVESSEDWDLWLGAAARGWRGRCVPEVLVHYRRS